MDHSGLGKGEPNSRSYVWRHVNLCINDVCGFLEMCMWHLQLCRRRRRCLHRLSSFLKMLKNKISVNVRPAGRWNFREKPPNMLTTCKNWHLSLLQSPSLVRQQDLHPPSIILLHSWVVQTSPSPMGQALLLFTQVLLLAKQWDVSHPAPIPWLLSPCIGCSWQKQKQIAPTRVSNYFVFFTHRPFCWLCQGHLERLSLPQRMREWKRGGNCARPPEPWEVNQ